MLLKNLQLINFRNYSQKEFSFSAGVTVIVGANASGKTNILEAIYLLSTGRSFRAGLEREMIREGEEVCRISGKISNLKFHPPASGPNPKLKNENTDLEAVLTPGSVLGKKAPYKRFLVNGVGKRFSDFVGNLPAVLFWPEDLELVTDSPSLRRRYLDMVLSQVDREYCRASLAYEKALRVRNKILQGLKNAQNDYAAVHQVLAREGEMDYWEKVLVESGEVITRKREEYMGFINKIPNFKFHPEPERSSIQGSPAPSSALVLGQISNQFPIPNFKFQIEYKKSEISYDRLGEYRVREAAAGMTLVGPHRDDFVVSLKAQPRTRDFVSVRGKGSRLKDKDLSIYGSRGEQRLGVLWLKLGEMEFVEKKLGLRPILLLDDILSELDYEHRKLVMGIIPKQQTIITTTDLHVIEKGLLKEAKVIKI